MKTKLSFMLLACAISTSIFAQEKDFRNRSISQSGNVYTVTYSDKTDNGGTAYEKWTGKLVNGKREGQWTLYAKYTNYMYGVGAAQTGTINVVRNYKNGIPSGAYSANYNITERGIRYNVLTDRWVYGKPTNASESVIGAFANGIPRGTWKSASTRFKEYVTITFNEQGRPAGTMQYTKSGQNLNVKFTQDGYASSIKEPQTLDGSWWYELDYGGKNPKTIFPQDTVSLSRSLLTYWEYWAHGMEKADFYEKYYPGGASDDKTPSTYIVSAYNRYYVPKGNVPEYEIQGYWNKLYRPYEEKMKEFQEEYMHDFRVKLNNNYTGYIQKLAKNINAYDYIENTICDSLYEIYLPKIDSLYNVYVSQDLDTARLNSKKVKLTYLNSKNDPKIKESYEKLKAAVDSIINKHYPNHKPYPQGEAAYPIIFSTLSEYLTPFHDAIGQYIKVKSKEELELEERMRLMDEYRRQERLKARGQM